MDVKNERRNTRAPELYREHYRPQFHFSAPRNWLNDPNGLVWLNGLFHLYYQHNPTGNEWGNMHWGHAVSRDLLHWDVRPLALHADPLGVGYIFSGSIVVDHTNSSGLGRDGRAPMVALYTGCDTLGVQTQSLAFSLDEGETWQQYRGNPVIGNPRVRDFRDPKVFWHEPTKAWVMSLAVYDHVEFYQSTNLLQWKLLSEFRNEHDPNNGVYECPDLFPLRTDSGEEKWVLIVSLGPAQVPRRESIKYYVGDFDGTRFLTRQKLDLWLDHGADCYGAVTWSGVPESDGRCLLIGWMNNWRYANALPTYPWRGSMTVPRTLHLVEGRAGPELRSLPVVELASLRRQTVTIETQPIESSAVRSVFSALSADVLDLDLVFSWTGDGAGVFGVRFANATGDEATVLVDPQRQQLSVDRTQVGQRIPNAKFAEKFVAPLRRMAGGVALRIVKDRSSVEAFGDDGRAVISANLFFDEPFTSVFVVGPGDVSLQGRVSILQSVWN